MSPNLKLVSRGAFAALVLALALPAVAAADSPDVTSATGSIVSVDGAGNQTVEVHGTWAWPTHKNQNCNADRAGIGIAIDWGDSNGNHVTTLNGDSIDVGVLAADALNTAADNIAHPAEPQTLTAASATDTTNWRSTCGVYAFDPALNESYNSGGWGTVTVGPDAGTHYLTHVFPPGPIPTICALTYDMHDGGKGSLNPPDASDLVAGGAGHNADNSAEKNSSHVVGNICAQVKGLKPPPPPVCCDSPPPPNPAIAIDKTGPATANVGDAVPYDIVITNVGDVSFADDKVVVTDPLCSAAPTLTSKNGDKTESTFDPGDHWSYTCSVQTSAGQTAIHNVATLTATPPSGPALTASDPADTVLNQPQLAVLPLLPGSARLRGPAGCLAGGPHKLVVTGRRIAKVSFFLDGKRVATRTKADSHGRFTYTVNRKHLRTGIHRIVARVTYLPETVGGARTFRRTFAKCARALKPEFTG